MGRGGRDLPDVMGKCRRCGRLFKRELLSARRLCPECQVEIVVENVKALKEKKGEYYEKYKMGMMRYFQKIFGDEIHGRRSKKAKKNRA